MASVETEKYDAYIVMRGGQYVAGYWPGLGKVRMTDSPWDAWAEKSRAKAQLVANRVGGKIRKWNPVTGIVG